MLTGIVLTHNEAQDLPHCLTSLKFCDHVVVVDDGSTDDTVKIAASLGAQVLQHSLQGDFAAQRNWALSKVKSTWVLFVDADEVITPALADEIKQAITKIECKGFLICRADHMWGKELKHGDVGDVNLLRLARRGAGQWSGKVHETWQIEGRVGRLRQPLLHHPHPNLVDFLRQINLYSSIRAQELYDFGVRSSVLQIIFYPVFKFLWLWIWKLGCLDGTAGFIHAMTMAFYSFLVRGKVWLLYKGIPPLNSRSSPPTLGGD